MHIDFFCFRICICHKKWEMCIPFLLSIEIISIAVALREVV
jgi:hypothetical protein